MRGNKVVAGVIVLLTAAGLAATQLTNVSPRGPAEGRGAEAPELTGIAAWINAEPFTLADLRGEVVLLDFWTYSCVNCVRTFPHLRALHERYRGAGLNVVGVHSPEFEFEREEANVRAAVRRHDLSYPVVMDNQMRTWRAYRNRFWPRVYLIGSDGTIRWDHIGEGGEAEIERRVRELLAETDADLPAPLSLAEGGPSRGITPEVYLGTERAETGTHTLEGAWSRRPEFVEAREGARIVLPFVARDVYVVAGGSHGARIEVLLDGEPIGPGAAPAGLTDGALTLTRADIYQLVALDEVREGTLTLLVPPGVRVYTFTFG